MSRLVIKQHRPLRLILIIIVASLLLSSTLWMFVDESHWYMIRSRTAGARQVKELWESNQKLEKENRQLKDKLLILERTAGIDQKATQEIKDQFLKLQEQYYDAKSELDFYEGIMDSTRDSKGLNVQGLYLQRLGDSISKYRYRLVLTNVAKGDKQVDGTASIIIEGDTKDKANVLNLKDISNFEESDLHFSFKNFKKFHGYFMLPEGFNPNRVTVQLSQKGKDKKSIRRTFEWQNLSSW